MNSTRVAALILPLLCVHNVRAEDSTKLPKLVKTIALSNVEGRIDHMAFDARTNRLFVAALENNTVEVIDVEKGERIQTIKNLHEPQGLAFIPATNTLVVANGGDGSCQFYDAESMKLKSSIDLEDDADNVRYDASSNRLYVGHSKGALAILDAKAAQKIGDAKLSAHPEAFEIDTQAKRAYVNVPSATSIEIIDLEKPAVSAAWKLTDSKSNFPMALDATNHRLFVGCRSPARLLVFDTESGKEVAKLEIAGDPDDVFFDPSRKSIFVTGGSGSIDAFAQSDADHYSHTGRIPTASGARTSLLAPENAALYVAVPHRGAQAAEIRVYSVKQ